MDESLRPDQTRRRGVESTSIRLADGNLWGLALPRPRLRPVVVQEIDAVGRPVETIQVRTEYGYPLETRTRIEDFRLACDRGTADRQYEALFRLAISLIRLSHDVEREEAAQLLELDLDSLPGFVDSVLAVVFGAPHEPTDSPRKKEADV